MHTHTHTHLQIHASHMHTYLYGSWSNAAYANAKLIAQASQRPHKAMQPVLARKVQWRQDSRAVPGRAAHVDETASLLPGGPVGDGELTQSDGRREVDV